MTVPTYSITPPLPTVLQVCQEPVLPYNKNNLVFEYVDCISPILPKTGINISWKDTMISGLRFFRNDITSLSETASWRLPVFGEGRKLRRSMSEPASFSFTIKPPVWKTGWFYALEVLAGIGLVYAFVRIRVRKLQRDKKVLAQKVKERTLEIERQRDHIAEINR